MFTITVCQHVHNHANVKDNSEIWCEMNNVALSQTWLKSTSTYITATTYTTCMIANNLLALVA